LPARGDFESNTARKFVTGTLSIHLSTASNLVGKLELQRLARRERSRDDRRVTRVFPTPRGTRTLRDAPRPVEGVISDALRSMPPGGLARLCGDLGLLLELASVRNRKPALKPLADP
jgi:DNA-binding MarR family transcriptional regulator